MSRAVMQQALEALEWAWGGEPLTGKEMVAIAALRAALAEPEQGPISLNNGRLTQYPDGSIGVGKPAEPEQPVAYARDKDNPCYMFTDPPSQHQPEQEPVGYWDGKFSPDGGATLYEVPQISHFGRKYPNIPVYAAPALRKPLTDDEIERACVPLGAAMLSFTEVARAIERAHGITGDQT